MARIARAWPLMWDRRSAYLFQFALCQRRAQLDSSEMHAFWMAEAAKWKRRAELDPAVAGREAGQDPQE